MRKSILAITTLVLSTSVNAATLVYDGLNLASVKGLATLGTTWDVAFNAGSFDAVYGVEPLPFSQSDNFIASYALNTELFAQAPTISPMLIQGCTFSDSCYIATPFDKVISGAHTQNTSNVIHVNRFGVPLGISDFIFFSNADDLSFVSYVTWKEAVVPIPAAFWLFGSGLLGLIGVARRKKS